jgi:hypothetical protein
MEILFPNHTQWRLAMMVGAGANKSYSTIEVTSPSMGII